MANPALRVDEVERRPVLVVESAPDAEVAVDRDRKRDPVGVRRPVDVRRALLELEFRRVHADHDESGVLVLLGPGADVRHRPQAVDARVGPDVDQHHLAAEALRGQRRRVDPLGRAGEGRQAALDAERCRRLFASGERERCGQRPDDHREKIRLSMPASSICTVCAQPHVAPVDSSADGLALAEWAMIETSHSRESSIDDAPSEPLSRRHQMFPVLTEAEIARMRRFGTVRRYAAGDRLVAPARPGPGMFVVLEGAVDDQPARRPRPRRARSCARTAASSSPRSARCRAGRRSSTAIAEGDVEALLVPPGAAARADHRRGRPRRAHRARADPAPRRADRVAARAGRC